MSLDTLRTSPPKSKALNIALWIVQILLGLNFLFAGGMKVASPIAELMKMIPAPGALIRFIGVAEFAGGLGLLLPSLLRIKPWLTPLAAGGLVIILSGATGMGVVGGKLEPALTPFAIMLFAGFVAIGRSRWIPLEEKTRKTLCRSVDLPAPTRPNTHTHWSRSCWPSCPTSTSTATRATR